MLMNKILRYSFVALMAMIGLNISAQEVTFDFTSVDNPWGLPTDGTTAETAYTYDGYTIKLAAPDAFKINPIKESDVVKSYYLIMGKSGATLTFPAFSFDVEKIVIEGRTGASGKVTQNIFVGETEVSTQTKGATETNEYMIAKDYQAAGNVYVLKVTNANNTQITKIKIYKASGVAAPEITGAEIFQGSTQVTITAEEGANIYYTTDGNDPTASDALYTAPFTIENSCVVKAVASKGDALSSVVSKQFTKTVGDGSKTNPFTCADLTGLPKGFEATGKWVKGIIIGSINNSAIEETPTQASNLALAEAAGETEFAKIVPVQLAESNKAALNVVDNPTNIGKELLILGDITAYFGNIGVKNTSEYEFAGEEDPGIDPTATIYEVPVSKFTPWDNCTIEGNKITMGEGWKGGAIYIGKDMTQFDYVWIKFKDATGTPNFGINYDEWQKNESWGPVFAATATAMDGTGMVGIKLDKKTVMVHGNAETDGVGIGDVYAQHVQQVTIQGGSAAASVEVEGIWFGTTAEFVKAGGDVPVRPEAGGSLTMWEGEIVYNGWSVSSTVDPKYFEVAEVGDIIYCSVKDAGADMNPLFKYQDWSDFTDIQATLAKDETHFEGKIATADALDYLQKNGLRFQGQGFTLTKVELKVPAGSGINTINAAKVENAVRYNLAGQKVDNSFKGVVIVNGKKMLQK